MLCIVLLLNLQKVKPRYSATVCSLQFLAVCRGWRKLRYSIMVSSLLQTFMGAK